MFVSLRVDAHRLALESERLRLLFLDTSPRSGNTLAMVPFIDPQTNITRKMKKRMKKKIAKAEQALKN